MMQELLLMLGNFPEARLKLEPKWVKGTMEMYSEGS